MKDLFVLTLIAVIIGAVTLVLSNEIGAMDKRLSHLELVNIGT